MPKKSASVRGNAQRNRAKLQKNIQLVRPVSAAVESESEINEEVKSTSSAVATSTAPTLVAEVEEEEATEEVVPTPVRESAKRARSARAPDTSARSATSPVAPASPASSTPAASGSASARLAARRQQQQPVQKTRQVSLVTAEHYAYVRRDLILIAILAILMFGTLVVLHFVPAIGG